MEHLNSISGKILLIVICVVIFSQLNAQYNNTVLPKYMYRPGIYENTDPTTQPDSQNIYSQHYLDSIRAREKFIQDSIQIRLKFIQDLIIAREKFVRDSVIRRQQILDSLHFLRVQLPKLFDASLKAIREDMIIYNNNLEIIGDSMLCDYSFITIPFNINKPFTPWKSTINLSDNPVKIEIDTIRHKITSIESQLINCTYDYIRTGGNIIQISHKSTIIKKPTGNIYKLPVDSVFFDIKGRVFKVKRYNQFYQATGSYKKGAKLFDHLTQVKQYEYGINNLLSKLEVVNFCDRWKIQDEHKVSYSVTYIFNKQDNIYKLARTNDPVNEYSDGTFIYEFDTRFNPKSISFNNVKNTENWKCYVDLNESGNVCSYKYLENGFINKSLMINYYHDDPKAKNKVETISCSFEKDGVSYYQINNTTEKSRSRDKLTMEWSPWK